MPYVPIKISFLMQLRQLITVTEIYTNDEQVVGFAVGFFSR